MGPLRQEATRPHNLPPSLAPRGRVGKVEEERTRLAALDDLAQAEGRQFEKARTTS